MGCPKGWEMGGKTSKFNIANLIFKIMVREVTYSKIISPEEFNRINTEEHLYIKVSDAVIVKFIEEIRKKLGRNIEVVEIGCGPARILGEIAKIKNINLTAIDHDKDFVAYARKKVKGAEVKVADIETYNHGKPVDVFYSQGVHHHIAKPPKYFQNIRKQLNNNGIFILSDEFLPNYNSEEERRLRAVIWYSHIISHAQKNNHKILAQEEAKTLLDELNTEIDESRIKTEEQINLVLSQVDIIDEEARKGNVSRAEIIVKKFLNNLSKIYNYKQSGDPTLDLSRGDYKICDKVFREEIKSAGFTVEKFKAVGPIDSIGAMVVYVLKKK